MSDWEDEDHAEDDGRFIDDGSDYDDEDDLDEDDFEGEDQAPDHGEQMDPIRIIVSYQARLLKDDLFALACRQHLDVDGHECGTCRRCEEEFFECESLGDLVGATLGLTGAIAAEAFWLDASTVGEKVRAARNEFVEAAQRRVDSLESWADERRSVVQANHAATKKKLAQRGFLDEAEYLDTDVPSVSDSWNEFLNPKTGPVVKLTLEDAMSRSGHQGRSGEALEVVLDALADSSDRGSIIDLFEVADGLICALDLGPGYELDDNWWDSLGSNIPSAVPTSVWDKAIQIDADLLKEVLAKIEKLTRKWRVQYRKELEETERDAALQRQLAEIEATATAQATSAKTLRLRLNRLMAALAEGHGSLQTELRDDHGAEGWVIVVQAPDRSQISISPTGDRQLRIEIALVSEPEPRIVFARDSDLVKGRFRSLFLALAGSTQGEA